MKKSIVVAAAVFVFSSPVLAGTHPNTGCGLGTEVIENPDTVVKQVIAVTTNGTSGNQTFGITSGSLGCAKPERFVSRETHIFVAKNMDELATDIAMGQGERADTLAALLNIEDKDAFSAELQQNFDLIYTGSNVDSAQVIDNILTVIG